MKEFLEEYGTILAGAVGAIVIIGFAFTFFNNSEISAAIMNYLGRAV